VLIQCVPVPPMQFVSCERTCRKTFNIGDTTRVKENCVERWERWGQWTLYSVLLGQL
jgi:hypothetical protein